MPSLSTPKRTLELGTFAVRSRANCMIPLSYLSWCRHLSSPSGSPFPIAKPPPEAERALAAEQRECRLSRFQFFWFSCAFVRLRARRTTSHTFSRKAARAGCRLRSYRHIVNSCPLARLSSREKAAGKSMSGLRCLRTTLVMPTFEEETLN